MVPGHLGPATRGNAKGREGLQAGPEVGNHRHTGAGELGGGGQTIRAARRVEPLTAVLQGGKGSEAHDIPDERVEARGREGEPEVGAGDGGETGGRGDTQFAGQVLAQAAGEGAVPKVVEAGAEGHGRAAGAARGRCTAQEEGGVEGEAGEAVEGQAPESLLVAGLPA